MNTDKPGGALLSALRRETLASVQSSPEGISGTEAATRLQQYGENALPQKPGKPARLRFIAHFNDVLIYVLLAAALLKGGDGPLDRHGGDPRRGGGQCADRLHSGE